MSKPISKESLVVGELLANTSATDTTLSIRFDRVYKNGTVQESGIELDTYTEIFTIDGDNDAFEYMYGPDADRSYSAGTTTFTLSNINNRGLPYDDVDYTSGVSGNRNGHIAGAKVEVRNDHYSAAILNDIMRGNGNTGSTDFAVGDGTASNQTLSVWDDGGKRGITRRNNATGKAQFSNDGTTWVNFEDVSASNLVQVTAADTTAGYLNAKVVGGDGITTSVLNPAGDEDLNLAIDLTDTNIFKNASAGVGDAGIAPVLDAAGRLDTTITGATYTEINDALSGISANVTQTNLDTLTASTASDADALHTHPTLLVKTNLGQTTRAAATASGTEVIAHGLGRTPKQIMFFANSQDANNAFSHGCVDDDMDNACTYDEPGTFGKNTAIECIFISDATNAQTANVSAWDATNFTLTWTKVMAGEAAVVTWIALG